MKTSNHPTSGVNSSGLGGRIGPKRIPAWELHWVYLTLKFGKRPLIITSMGGGKDLLGGIFIKWIGDHFFYIYTNIFASKLQSSHYRPYYKLLNIYSIEMDSRTYFESVLYLRSAV